MCIQLEKLLPPMILPDMKIIICMQQDTQNIVLLSYLSSVIAAQIFKAPC